MYVIKTSTINPLSSIMPFKLLECRSRLTILMQFVLDSIHILQLLLKSQFSSIPTCAEQHSLKTHIRPQRHMILNAAQKVIQKVNTTENHPNGSKPGRMAVCYVCCVSCMYFFFPSLKFSTITNYRV